MDIPGIFLEFFIILKDDPSLRKRFKEEKLETEFKQGDRRFIVTYIPFVSSTVNESQCIVCGRPARHVCVIRVLAIKVLGAHPEQLPFTVDLRTKSSMEMRAHAEEHLLHHQSLCLFQDCVRPTSNH